ncbi:MAG: hypothetical protein Q4D82_07950 [Neisseria sp.]|nr:hypothetical protein [Neisseria sp.]
MKNLFNKTVLAAALAMIAAPTLAANWVKVDEDNEAAIYFDSSSMRQDSDGDGIVWVKYKYKPGHYPKTGKKIYDEAKTRFVISCSKKVYAIADVNTYYKNKLVDSASERNLRDWDAITPDTRIDMLYHAACN